jgi:sialidase-1
MRILLFIVVTLVMHSGAAQITQQHVQLPVLTHKDNNPVLRMHVYVPENSQRQLNEFVFSVAGHAAVKEARLFYAGADSNNTNLNNAEKLQLFGRTSVANEKINIKGNQTISAGHHYFWLSLHIDTNANLLHTIRVNALSADVNGKRNKVTGTSPIPLRLGLALRKHNQDQVHTYRIPGLATAKDGTLLAIYDVRRQSARDLQGDIDIGLSRSTDGGQSWQPMQIVLDMQQWGGLPSTFNGVSDACILVNEHTGAIFIAGLWMHGVLDEKGKWIEGLTDTSTAWNHQWRNKGSQPGIDPKQTAQFLITKSDDNGKTWSKPINLTTQCKQGDWWLWAPAPGHGITLRDGTLVFPTQGRDKTGKAFSNITYSKDGGNSWTTSHRAAPESTTENMAVELSDGSIMLNMRCGKNKNDTSHTNGRVVAVTTDLGNTWTSHPSSRGALPEPVCMASIIRHDYIRKGKKKSVLLFSNPDSKTTRHRMTIKISYDDGLQWPAANKILLDEWKSRGYSCLTSIDNDTIGILYESSQADMVFQKIRLTDLLQ